MAFGRRKAGAPAETGQDGFDDDLTPEERAAEDAELLAELEGGEQAPPGPPPRPQGPWDIADVPPREDPPRLDLGGLQVPVPPDTEVRVDVSPEGEVVAATLVQGPSAMQLNAFAAPRTQGIWAEVRAEILEALNAAAGGDAEEVEGPFGLELRANVPSEVEGEGVVLAPARFLGVDGPRWFLRGLVTGPAATDPAAAGALEAALRDVVVVRGSDPMAVRDALPLVLPAQALAPTAGGDEPPSAPQLQERGPEITEIH